jgi:Tfp pilus assembly protein PilN
MIKINLSPAQKQLDFSNFGGLDFTRVKIVPVFVAIVALYLPDFILVPMWEEDRNAKSQEISEKKGELGKLRSQVNQSAVLEKQIRELKIQEENLRKKLTAVKQAISEKKNPSNLLLYIAKNIPPELWIKELTIDGDSMLISGEALNYTSVGNFLNNLKSSVFIKDSNIINSASEVRESDKRRVETFQAKFGIARFE